MVLPLTSLCKHFLFPNIIPVTYTCTVHVHLVYIVVLVVHVVVLSTSTCSSTIY